MYADISLNIFNHMFKSFIDREEKSRFRHMFKYIRSCPQIDLNIHVCSNI